MYFKEEKYFMKTISLNFDGYWSDDYKSSIPNSSGIYCVYSCFCNPSERTVDLHRVLYIGESENVQERLQNHEKFPKWCNYLKNGESICYSFAPINSNDRERAEAALIYKIKPPCNTEHSKQFAYLTTEMIVTGKNSLLPVRFIVQ